MSKKKRKRKNPLIGSYEGRGELNSNIATLNSKTSFRTMTKVTWSYNKAGNFVLCSGHTVVPDSQLNFDLPSNIVAGTEIANFNDANIGGNLIAVNGNQTYLLLCISGSLKTHVAMPANYGYYIIGSLVKGN